MRGRAYWALSLCRKLASNQQQQEIDVKSIRVLLAELKSCTSTRNLQRGNEIYAKVMRSGNDFSIYVATALVTMFAKCGSMVDARQVFESVPQPDLVLWNSIILGYAENGDGLTALDLFARMKSQGCVPDSFTFVAALKACASLAQEEQGRAEWLFRGKEIHSDIRCHLNIYVYNTLIDMYAKCGSIVDAHQVFDSMKSTNLVSWNALLLGYAENGQGVTALDLFAKMRSQGFVPNSITFVAALKACTCFGHDATRRKECLEQGRQIHSEVMNYHGNTCVQNSLIDMYSKCGSMADARKVFEGMNHQDVVSWNALILGYAQNWEACTALDMFARMTCAPNFATLIAALKACTSLVEQDGSERGECLNLGKQLHSDLMNYPLTMYAQNTLIEMYSKCGSMVDAQQVFDSIPYPNVVSWNSLILGYAKNGEAVIALDLFTDMKLQGCTPNCITYVAALKACTLLGALESGAKIHADIDASIEWDAILVTCLVDFYSKCGNLVEAQHIFSSRPTREIRTWTALLTGYTRLGDSKAVFTLFQGMQDAGFHPDGVTFLCILSCCSHAGFVEKANEFFESMFINYKITPSVEHYNCMVDILGRSNKLDDAIALLRSMPCRPNSWTWMIILSACRKWKNVGIGRLAFRSLVSLEDTNAAAYVLMGHIYGSKGMWKEQEIILGMKRKSS